MTNSGSEDRDMQDKPKVEEYLTSKEVCEMFKISPSTLARRVREDQIPYLVVGKSKRFRKADLEDWAARNMYRDE